MARRSLYELAVEQVLLDHDHVDDLRVFESQKAETARAAGNTISHHSAFCDLSELREVVFERFCRGALAGVSFQTWATAILLTIGGLPVEAANEHLAVYMSVMSIRYVCIVQYQDRERACGRCGR